MYNLLENTKGKLHSFCKSLKIINKNVSLEIASTLGSKELDDFGFFFSTVKANDFCGEY